MSDLDLAVLTEAVQERLTIGGDYNPLDWSLSDVVRAVLETLLREWGVEHGRHRRGLEWYGLGALGGHPPALCTGSPDCRLVWRAVGPTIPAEDQP